MTINFIKEAMGSAEKFLFFVLCCQKYTLGTLVW